MSQTTAERAEKRSPGEPTTVALVRLGCARNDVDAEELAARLESGGFRLVDEPADAEAVLVNTCGFVEAAKQDSVDTLLEAAELKSAGTTRAVVAVGCLAERYGKELADALPEATVLGFDDYPDIATRIREILTGRTPAPHAPRDRRTLLPISPVARPSVAAPTPGHGTSAPDLPAGLAPASGPRAVRRRLDGGPVAPVKLASGCDRRCSFCAIPRFRGAFLSRPPAEILAEARWLAEQGVRELFLVSENSTSYGKDLGDLRLLEQLLPELAAIDGIDRVRVSYLQPAELRPSLVEVLATTLGVAAYFDLSFQHASGPVLRRMRRFGDADRFLALLDLIRAKAPTAGIRSNFIIGFPGETDADFAELCGFVEAARLDAIGVFAYSDEDGTEAASFDGKVDDGVIEERRRELSDLADQLIADRAEERIGEPVEVLVESVEAWDAGDAGESDDFVGGTRVTGRAEHQGPDVDGATELMLPPGSEAPEIGAIVPGRVVAAEGVDLRADACARPADSVR